MCDARRVARTALLIAATLAGAGPLAAQQSEPAFLDAPRLEWRGDLAVRDVPSFDLGGGVAWRAGYYARLAVLAGAGTEWRDQRAGGTAHVDIVSRYLLDPFRETRWGLYGGAGATVRWTPRERAHPYLLLVAGVEGPERGRWRPAVEFALGGGARLGIVLRRARDGAR